ncbi:hypothetical protein JAAARDRAFT_125594 [Jaapia argillacea MUCL 33604]|uniref:Uncharacterized protein n=1 Tax=Jaapia argillacea MUCL 33604 TaxID=933084 RepID=A0A067Q9T0_9AGAM|nr:hypothetical protein JAAARDRAFT_125594 [Jaapia argillacea MUCL 33604]
MNSWRVYRRFPESTFVPETTKIQQLSTSLRHVLVRSLLLFFSPALLTKFGTSVIFGRAIKPEFLAIGTLLGTTVVAMSSMGGKKEAAGQTIQQVKESVKIDASSKEEEDLFDSIKKFIADAEKDSKH